MGIVPVLLWGFLVGFVGWGACFRLIEPVAEWLLQHTKTAGAAVGVARLLVAMFLIFAVLVALSLVPLLLVVLKDGAVNAQGQAWKNLYGASFIGSLLGFIFLGLTRRQWAKR